MWLSEILTKGEVLEREAAAAVVEAEALAKKKAKKVRFPIKNHEFCIQNGELCIKMIMFAFKMMNLHRISARNTPPPPPPPPPPGAAAVGVM